MKIVQSFWSKPAFHNHQDYSNARKFGGWNNFRYFLLSTSFSALTLRRDHKELELFTDSAGMHLYIDILQLPYDNVSLALDQLADEDHTLWILGKLIAIRSQNGPFLHVDNDVYRWGAFPEFDSSGILYAQSLSPMSEIYRSSLSEIQANFKSLPDCMKLRPGPSTMVANAGIIGGSDIDFFQEFCALSADIVEKNRHALRYIQNAGGLNPMLEEYLFTRLAESKERKIHYLFDTSADKVYFDHILRINLAPFHYKYIHLLGSYKQSYYACEQLELRLQYEFPEQFSKISQSIDEHFPQLQQDEHGDRRRRLLRGIDVLYRNDLEAIERTRVRLREGFEIIRAQEYLDSSDVVYAVRETDTAGRVKYRRLPFFLDSKDDYLLGLFDTPVSINELFEMVRPAEASTDIGAMNALKFRLINAVTRFVVIYGILEFVY